MFYGIGAPDEDSAISAFRSGLQIAEQAEAIIRLDICRNLVRRLCEACRLYEAHELARHDLGV